MLWFLDRMMQRCVAYKSSGGGAERIITEDMRAAAEVATEQWNDYQSRFAPFENKFKADMEKDPTTQQAALRGKVSADLAQKAATAVAIPAGADPTKALTASAINRNEVGKAAASGSASVTQGALNRQAQGLNTVVAMGRGQATDALQTQSALAESSAQAALTDAKTNMQDRWANEAMTASLISKGVGAAGGVAMYGADQGWFNQSTPGTQTPQAAYSHDLVNQQSVQGGVRYPGTVSLFNQ